MAETSLIVNGDWAHESGSFASNRHIRPIRISIKQAVTAVPPVTMTPVNIVVMPAVPVVVMVRLSPQSNAAQ
jgi:hypothetical protein